MLWVCRDPCRSTNERTFAECHGSEGSNAVSWMKTFIVRCGSVGFMNVQTFPVGHGSKNLKTHDVLRILKSLLVSVLTTAETFSRDVIFNYYLYRQRHRILYKKWRSTKTDTVRWQKLRVWVQFGPTVYGIGWTDIAMCGVKHYLGGLFFFFRVPQLDLWGSPFWVRFFCMWPLF